ncbi:MAG TPA: sulfur carrier protein ThiS adenylyltransferase ThiF [Candidatus Cloacimonadota bacterium]|nr:sulfur carrier protein ThiS adenylyltransferase ThiF [Candidatus Cloacimonadota bacterium]
MAHDPAQLKAWQAATIGIAGAGGLGSNIANLLYRAGVGKLIIADFDRITPSNLNRQFYFQDQIGRLKVEALKENLERIGGNIELSIHPIRVEALNLPELFGEAEILIEAFDRAEEKSMLLEAWTEAFPQKYYIGASGLSGVGRNESIHTEQFGNIYIIGDGCSEPIGNISPISARVTLVGAMQANLALE